MKRKIKSGSGVWHYLEQIGVLERGTPDEIEAARKAYWKEVRRKWKHEKRTAITLSLSHDEYRVVHRAAKKHHKSPSAFVKQAALCYIDAHYLVPDIAAIQEIRMLLARNYFILQTLGEDSGIGPDLGAYILQRMEQLEHQVLLHLEHPVAIETYIRDSVTENPACRERFLQLLQSM